MKRQPNTDREGISWSESIQKAVWRKGTTIPNYSAELWRLDTCGKIMHFPEHGNRQSNFGWEIDHIIPVAGGGTDALDNLQPLNWHNNAQKGDQVEWNCW
jgi:hypothetical protein